MKREAQTIAPEQLIDTWVFEAYAKIGSPDERQPVGAVFEFHADGTFTTRRSSGEEAKTTCTVDGNTTIIYSDRQAIAGQWQEERRFAPERPAAEVERRRALWRRGVERARGWEDAEA